MTIVENFRLPLILLATVGSAVSGGIFFAFSTFVMQALAKQPTSQGIATMQSINITVINPWFMAAFFAPDCSWNFIICFLTIPVAAFHCCIFTYC